MTVLAADVGGTNTRLALFEPGNAVPMHLETFASNDHASLDEMIRLFLAEHPVTVDAACAGVAGPVRAGRTETVNLAWPVDGASLATTLGLPSVTVLNDLEANAWGLGSLGPDDVAGVLGGIPDAAGNRAVISAGTGLGQAGLYWDGTRHHVFATEGGHADFAPRSELEIDLYRFLAAELGHVSYERVVSGMGLVNIHRFLVHRDGSGTPGWLAEAIASGTDAAAAISRHALEMSDPAAVRALDLMLSIFGAQAGNLALSVMATGGVYLGGGIAPKILPRLRAGGFAEAFLAKGRFAELMSRIPVHVILNQLTALVGAARRAERDLKDHRAH
ncbi:MAG: glucokinase [Actinomycetota bacterium]|jgi:glucokinase|nr:glucokinase [Actinomycetota bacterium]